MVQRATASNQGLLVLLFTSHVIRVPKSTVRLSAWLGRLKELRKAIILVVMVVWLITPKGYRLKSEKKKKGAYIGRVQETPGESSQVLCLWRHEDSTVSPATVFDSTHGELPPQKLP